MDIKLVCHTARNAVIEIADGGRYFTKKPYRVLVNGEEIFTTEKTVNSLYGLKPDENYRVEVFDGEEKPSADSCRHLPDFQSVFEKSYENRAGGGSGAEGIYGEGEVSCISRDDRKL